MVSYAPGKPQVGEIHFKKLSRDIWFIGHCDATNRLCNGFILQIIGLSLKLEPAIPDAPLLLYTISSKGTVMTRTIILQPSLAQLPAQKEKVDLTAVLNNYIQTVRWGKSLLEGALTKLKTMYPNLDIQLKYGKYPTNQLRPQLLTTLNGTKASDSIDSDIPHSNCSGKQSLCWFRSWNCEHIQKNVGFVRSKMG